MAIRLLTSGLLGVAAILTTTLLAPQAPAVPPDPCNEYTVGNIRHEGGSKWICFSYGQGRYEWRVTS
ncbi:hypothetical protein [Nocardia sp. NPDC003345]